MSEFINFITQNWKVLTLMTLFIINLFFSLIIFIKSFKTNKGFYLSVLSSLPSIINDAESKCFTNGQAKFNFVLEEALKLLSNLNGFTYQDNLVKFGNVLSHDIEEILSTPQKKQGKEIL